MCVQAGKRNNLERLESDEGLTLDISDTLDMFTEELPVKAPPVIISPRILYYSTKFLITNKNINK
jgi:hypothetical protein